MPDLHVIPLPASVTDSSAAFTLNADSSIQYKGGAANEIAELLASCLRPSTGFELPVNEGHCVGNCICLEQTGTAKADDAGFVDESYELTVSESRVVIKAPTDHGLARGVQILRQLLPAENLSGEKQDVDWTVPAVSINDAPQLRWRGLHLDVCRHFFSVEEVCKFIDLAALHRMNTVHLHLTEDQGWRIEIKKYPKLTEIGSVRNETLVGHESTRPRQYDGKPYSGFYSHDDIRRIVTFATARRINQVPEIDMPGHMVAAIAAYPELGNVPENQVRPRCHWGISQQVLNCSDETVAFMKDVLAEVMDLFPGPFIHIGGDEAPKFEWSETKSAQDRMSELGLKSEDELQSWFIQQMDTFITEKGRRMIGWDEILEGGLAENAAVMSWRGEEAGIETANSGHDVVMAPHQEVYFDYYQHEPADDEPLAIGGMTTTEEVYAYSPIPDAIKDDKRHHVLGAQGQLWTEYMPNFPHVEYMTYPRACALAEVLWTPKVKREYGDFLERLASHRKRLKVLGVNAHSKP
jgi:hexosaminidase